MKKRLLAMLLCLALLCLMLAGCGTGNTESAVSEAPIESVASAPAEEVSAAPVEEETPEAPVEETVSAEEPVEVEVPAGNEPKAQFPNADTADLKFSNVYELPMCEETETLTMMRASLNLIGPLANLGINSFAQVEYVAELEALTNVHLDITELNYFTMQEQFQLQIAANDLTDFMCGLTYAKGDLSALEEGVILDLTDMLEEYSPNYNYMINSSEAHANEFRQDGLVLNYVSPYEQYVANQGLVIRQDWLDEVGLDVPQTYEQLEEVLKAFKNTLNAQVPIYMNSQCYITSLSDGYDVAKFAADGGNDTAMPYFVDNGTVKCSLNEENYREYLKMLNSWYNDGLIDKDFISVTYDPFSSYITDQVSSDAMGIWCTSGEGVDTYGVDISCMPSLTKEVGGMDHIYDTSLTSDSFNDTYIAASSENAELAMEWMDYWYSADGILFANYGVEGKDYTIGENGQPQFTDAIINNEYDVTVSNMMRLECGYGVFSAPMVRYRTAEFNSDLVNEAWEVWSSNLDGSMTMPSYVSLNVEENEIEAGYSSDLLTYALQMVPQFVIGEADLDADWDEYVETLESMGLGECIEVWQQAYDRTK